MTPSAADSQLVRTRFVIANLGTRGSRRIPGKILPGHLSMTTQLDPLFGRKLYTHELPDLESWQAAVLQLAEPAFARHHGHFFGIIQLVSVETGEPVEFPPLFHIGIQGATSSTEPQPTLSQEPDASGNNGQPAATAVSAAAPAAVVDSPPPERDLDAETPPPAGESASAEDGGSDDSMSTVIHDAAHALISSLGRNVQIQKLAADLSCDKADLRAAADLPDAKIQIKPGGWVDLK